MKYHTIDGPTLRELRVAQGISLRRVAALAHMSHGHLSKMERGEEGRKITRYVTLAYEKATGFDLTNGIPDEALEPQATLAGVRMSVGARRSHVTELAAVTYGRPLERTFTILLNRHQRVAPRPLTEEDLVCVERVAELLADLDGIAGSLAEVTLRRLAAHLDDREQPPDPRLVRVCVVLAIRANRGADLDGRFGAGQALRLVALRLAVALGDPDLRALVLVRAADQFARRGWPEARDLLRLASGDDEVSELVTLEIKRVRRIAEALG